MIASPPSGFRIFRCANQVIELASPPSGFSISRCARAWLRCVVARLDFARDTPLSFYVHRKLSRRAPDGLPGGFPGDAGQGTVSGQSGRADGECGRARWIFPANASSGCWRRSQVVRQRSAKPLSRVRIPSSPLLCVTALHNMSHHLRLIPCRPCLGGGTGRRKGLKIPRASPVPVRVRP